MIKRHPPTFYALFYWNTAMTSPIEFSQEEKDQLIPKIKMYLKEELDQEIGNFDAEFLLDFFFR